MELLRSSKLEKYSESFENNAYDDLDFIESMTDVQLNDILTAVGIYERSGHRTKFFAAFLILQSKK